MIKKTFFLFSFLIVYFGGKAQIYSTHNFYTQNMFYYSPAHAGDKEQFSAFLAYRDHLTDLVGSNQTALFGMHSPITQRMNLGTMIKTERLGLFETLSGRLDYSFRAKISDNQLLAFGINGGFLQRNINVDNAIVEHPEDPTLAPDYAKRYIAFAGASINYQIKNFNIDLGIPVMYRSNDLSVQNYMSFISYSFYNKAQKWKFQPSVLVHYVPGRLLNYHGNFLINFDNLLWAQTTYKANKSLAFSIGLNFKNFGVAYAYEMNSSVLSAIGGPSHELMLTYGFFKKKKDLNDSLLTDEELERKLKRKIGDKTYEEYVSANNYGFYNSILDLTDSIHKEEVKIDSMRIKARADSIRNEQLRNSRLDSMEQNRIDSIEQARKDSIRRAQAFRHLIPEDLKLLEQGVQFDIGSAMINSESRTYLREVIKLLNSKANVRVLISGHTCDIGSNEVNLRYSQDRAEAVKYYLIRNGVNPSQVSTDAKLDAEPVVPNTNESNRQLNRRASFSIIRE